MESKDVLSNKESEGTQNMEAQSAHTLEQDIPEAADWVAGYYRTNRTKPAFYRVLCG